MTQALLDEQFDEKVLNAKGLVLVDFWAEWCGPCRQLGPILEAIDNEMGDTIKIYKMNVDDAPKTAGNFGLRSIPTLFLFKDGVQVDSKVGLVSQSTLTSWIKSYE